MADTSPQQLAGRLLTTFGLVWLVLFFVANSGAIGNSGFSRAVLQAGLFFPLIVLFVGRRLNRSGRRTSRTEETPTPPAPRPRRRVPEPRVPKPATARKPDPIVVPQTSDDDLAAAIGFDDSGAKSDQSETAAEVKSEPMEEQPMSSKDMIADARRQLDLDH